MEAIPANTYTPSNAVEWRREEEGGVEQGRIHTRSHFLFSTSYSCPCEGAGR